MKHFSERVGARVPSKAIQLNEMNLDLRNSLWNILVGLCDSGSRWKTVAEEVASELTKTPLDELPEYDRQLRENLKAQFFSQEWSFVYDVVEILPDLLFPDGFEYGRRHSNENKRHLLRAEVNRVLERELSGYRFIEGTLAPVADTHEVMEIEAAVSKTAARVRGAHEHLQTALSMLARRPTPDHRNAIKEAISAVESVCKVISGADRGGLAEALRELEKRKPIHGALRSALVSLYGYTSDEKGIRHALLDDASDIGFAEAKFMIVSCSAFVNYLLLMHAE